MPSALLKTFSISFESLSLGEEGISLKISSISSTSSCSLRISCSLFSKTASPNLVALVAFAPVVLLREEYGKGGDNGGAEGVIDQKIFCGGGNNGGAVG